MKRREFLTPEGWSQLQAEIQDYWGRRKLTVSALADAAAEGDRSENAEYIYRKKELREIDRRLRYLGRVNDNAEVVRDLPKDQETVRFGAAVTLCGPSGDEVTLRLVGAYEAQPGAGGISIDAPLARKLLGKRLDDVVPWKRGDAPIEDWEITDIRYTFS